jgi:AcrR family transcriptional regulator
MVQRLLGERAWARRDLPADLDSAHRDAIVAAARSLIQELGYHELTVERVIQTAGVARATFYFYFRNKRHLFIEVANSLLNELFEVAGRHYPENDEFTRIVLANVSYLSIWRRDSAVLCQFFAASLTDKEIHNIYDWHRHRFEVRITGRLQRLDKQGRIPRSDPELLAASLSSMVEFMAFRYFSCQVDVVKVNYAFQDLVRSLSESWYQAVYGKAAPEGYDYSRYLEDVRDELPGQQRTGEVEKPSSGIS